MDLSENSDGTDKSWDRPWSTDEMRQHSNNWSLAADAGLLKHLEQFSDNLTATVNTTREKLESLTNELNETAVIVDNITNASLALANTQFIESRVQEDDIETKAPATSEDKKANDEDPNKDDLIACVGESIRQGLMIMDEKFQRLEVLASDSEDDGEIPTPSIVLRPKDPYQNRPLPYVIGSDKWEASSRVGLESSSSDSEPLEGESESAMEEDIDDASQRVTNVNNRHESLLRRSSSSSSVSTDRNERGSTVNNYSGVSSRTDKLEARSQDTLNSGSEIATPTVGPARAANSMRAAPSFAEDLAKRLGRVLPSSAATVTETQDADQSSINRFNDDLFAPDDGDVFGDKSGNIFNDTSNLFDPDVSSSLWKEKPIRKPTVIPPSFDVPPPMNEVENPRSAFDDLCGDADSEDSDDLFASNSSAKNTANKSTYPRGDSHETGNSKGKEFLKIAVSENIASMATSTPEVNDNGGLFGDGTDDDDDELFGSSVKSRNRIARRSPEVTRVINRPKPPGLSITQAEILSSNLGSRLFQRVPRQHSSDSSDNDASADNEDAPVSKVINSDSNQNSGGSNHNNSEPSAIVAGVANGSRLAVVDNSESSGISTGTNNTCGISGTSLGAPQGESTRLKSEELYRERVTSDSIFTAGSRQPDHAGPVNDNSNDRPHNARIAQPLDSHQEEDFESDDVFGPPPLPKADASLADDLFSNASSGSRSRKSSDLLAANETQYDAKSASSRTRGLFDEDIDIFGTGDAPEVDIFGENFTTSIPAKEYKSSSLRFDKNTNESSTKKSSDLFFAETTESASSKKSERKINSIFDDSEEDDDDDLFGSSFLKNERKSVAMIESDDDNLFANKPKSSGETVPTETKKDRTVEKSESAAHVANKSLTELDDKRDSDEAAIGNLVPSYPSGGLFDNLDDEDDDDDSLFDNKKTTKSKESATSAAAEKKFEDTGVSSGESKMEESKFKTNCAKIEGLLKDQSAVDVGGKISSETEIRPSVSKKPPVTLKSPDLLARRKDTENVSRNIPKMDKEKEVSTTDGADISKARKSPEATGETTKRDPPKTLSIRLPMPSVGDDSTQGPRRGVSNKIKNLMGKMSDLKILSPTDTPPLWRKADEKSDEEPTNSRDSEDGSSISVPSTKSPTIASGKTDDSNIFPEVSKAEPNSPQDDSGNSETAVSFDVPAQVETLAVTASKSRARIQAKRRPQSRHARHSALRTSGIDFDTVDTSAPDAMESDPSDNTFSSISDKIPTVITDSVDSPKTNAGSERLAAPENDAESRSTDKPAESSSSLAPDDRSELSFSKGSSMSINKNTLLSPSTDEEDLFDVPPDLPEDPPKDDDTLFGRAPILSPIDGLLGSKNTRTKERSKGSRVGLNKPLVVEEDSKSLTDDEITKEPTKEKSSRAADNARGEDKPELHEEREAKPTDPLRDNSHDPLKDPSQLFAFVTKTPSPEKGQKLLFKEDDSLFTRLARKTAEEAKAASAKPTLDLFADDTSGDLFSGTLAKVTKKSRSGTKKNSLFDDMDTDEDGTNDLFSSGTRDKATTDTKVKILEDTVAGKSSETPGRESPNHGSIFDNDADDELFVDALDKKFSPEPEKIGNESIEDRLSPATSKIVKDAKLDIFGDQSSGEDDIFATKKTIGKTRATGSIFDAGGDDEDVNDIFGKKLSTKGATVETVDSRTTAKKAVTRDLKKTAEKIVKDPLSMLQDD